MRNLLQILTLSVLISCGQVDTKSTSETVTVASEAQTYQLIDTAVQFLWRDMKYDIALKDSFNSIFINEEYIQTMSDPEKAAIGYIATFIGNECWWDGKAKDDRSNLSCKILAALDLGYQCSDKHLGFLKQWFSNDNKVLSELESSNCPTTPYTATSQDTFDEIILTVKNDTIIVFYKANGTDMRKQANWKWSETKSFELKGKNLELVKIDKSPMLQPHK